MAEMSDQRPTQQPVVRPLSRATGRPCARPGCPSPSRATLTFSYADRQAWLGPLREDRPPHAYDLCVAHADRTEPPRGWRFQDQRPSDPEEPAGRELGGERTVAVLAAALHGGRPLPEDPDADDPLREALEELQAIELPSPAEVSTGDLRLVDAETRRRRREEAALPVGDDGIRDTVARARRAAGDLVRGPARNEEAAPGRQVPAAEERRAGDDEGPATLW